jgi:hypothetical protein
MPPFFTTSREIADEARLRMKHRQEGTDYETPGLGDNALEQFESQPVQHNIRTPGTMQSAPMTLPADVAENIKKGLKSGLFTAAQLAASYKVPVAAVEALRSA